MHLTLGVEVEGRRACKGLRVSGKVETQKATKERVDRIVGPQQGALEEI
jgi:hypothetical protein